jgi:hypothetical protein
MISYWRAEGNANDAYDANPGTFAANTYTTGKVGQAFSLDGNDDYVNIPYSSNLNISGKSFTLEAWAKRKQSGSVDFIFGQGQTNNNQGLHFGYRSDAFTFAFYNDDLDTPSIYTDVDEWHHWAGAYDASTNQKKLYRDGNLVASDTASDYLGSGDVTIGVTSWKSSGDYFNGLIDEVAIYNRALSQQEISHHSNGQPYCP